jgi:transcription antitermination factor NusG
MERGGMDRKIQDAAMQAEWLEPKWHALFVRSNQEKRVAQHLFSREIQYFLPAYESIRQWQDRKVKLISPLFPGYIFVRLSLVDYSKVLLVPNVVNLVGARNIPSVISDEEIEWIRQGIAHGKAEPHPYLKVGNPVVITAGPMAGMKGSLIRIQNCARVLVRLNSISRAFSVEVDSNCVEPAGAGADPQPCLLQERAGGRIKERALYEAI